MSPLPLMEPKFTTFLVALWPHLAKQNKNLVFFTWHIFFNFSFQNMFFWSEMSTFWAKHIFPTINIQSGSFHWKAVAKTLMQSDNSKKRENCQDFFILSENDLNDQTTLEECKYLQLEEKIRFFHTFSKNH